MQIIARCYTRFDFHGRRTRLKYMDKRGEEVVHAVAKLLNIGILIGLSLVPIDGNSLIDSFAFQVQPLAKRFHHQLLQVAAEQQ